MGLFSKFEGKMEDTFEGAAGKMNNAPISPVQIMKKAEKQMRREKMVSAGREFAPTLYTVLVNADDDARLFGFYPTLAGETETRLESAAVSEGLYLECKPLVRFIADESLKHGKFDVIAEVVSAPIIAQLREEEMQRYGVANARAAQQPQAARPQAAAPAYPQNAYQQQPAYAQQQAYAQPAYQQPQAYAAPAAAAGVAAAPVAFDPFGDPVAQGKPPLPNVPEDQIDYGTDYGEYTFNSANFDAGQAEAVATPASQPLAASIPLVQAADPFAVSQPLEQPAAAAAPQPEPQAAYQQPEAQPAYAQPEEQAYPGAYPVTYPAGAAGAFPATAAAGAAAAGAAYAAAPGTVNFTAGAGQANAVPNASAVHARLIDAASNRSYDLACNRVLVGRETGNDIVIPDANVSRQHAQIEFEPQGVWVVTDLGSTNGTLVNGTPVTRRGLADGDRLTLGVTELVFSLR